MKRIYIAGPFSTGDLGANLHEHIKAAHAIIDRGHCPLVPVLSHFLHISSPRPYELWMHLDFELLSISHAVLRLPGASPGGDRETAMAREWRIPVSHSLQELDEWLKRDSVGDPGSHASCRARSTTLRPEAVRASCEDVGHGQTESR